MDLGRYENLIKNIFRDKFERFKKLLLEYNERFNLTSVCDEKGIFYKHFMDSIIPEKNFYEYGNVVEIGSGAGFPSIPLKIVREDLKFTLIESTGKKCTFLNECVDKLNLSNVKILNIRAEEGALNGNLRESFENCCARAVARLNTLCEYCLPYLKVGGKFIAYKGDAEEEIKESLKAIDILGGKIASVENYELPEGFGKRTAIIIEKIKSTPEKYPRGRGLERKRPL